MGPLAGILITGPGGAVAAIGALAILYTALPAPEYTATVLELQVQSCEPAQSWRERAFGIWDQRLEVNTWATPPPQWRQTFEQAAASESVLTIDVVRHRDLGRGRRPWNRGALEASDWSSTRRPD